MTTEKVPAFASALSSAADAKRMTQEGIASACGCTQAAVSHWFAGSRFPSRQYISPLASTLDLPESRFEEWAAEFFLNKYNSKRNKV